jgi:DHA3 family macrolide efflux protein-like MFS transporter
MLQKITYKVKNIITSNKQFLFLWTSQILTQSAVSIISVMIGILSHEGTLSEGTEGSAAGIGIIVNLSTLPGLFVAPFAGVFADIFNKKRIMILADVLRFVILVFFIIIEGWENIWISYLLVFLLTTILQFYIPAEGGILPKVVKKKYILAANSLFSLVVYSTMGVGVVFSGLFLNIFGTNYTFLILALLFIISDLVLIFGVKVRDIKKVTSDRFKSFTHFIRNFVKDLKDGFRYLSKTKILKFSLAHLFLLQLVGLTLITIVFRLGEEVYGVSTRTAGAVVFGPMILGLVMAFASLNIFGRNRNRIKLILVGTIISSIGFFLMTVVSSAEGILARFFLTEIVASLSLLLIGFSIPFVLVPPQTLIYESTKDAFRGRIQGIWIALTSSLASLFSLPIGLLVDMADDITIGIAILVAGDIIYTLSLLYLLKRKYL